MVSRLSSNLTLPNNTNLNYRQNKYEVLKELVAEENIFVGRVAIRNIMRKWLKIRSFSNVPKANGCTIITEYDLNRLKRAVYNNRGLTVRKLKNLLKLNCSHRSVCRYLNAFFVHLKSNNNVNKQ